MVVLPLPFTSSLPVTVRSPTSAVSSPPTVISSTVTVSAVTVAVPSTVRASIVAFFALISASPAISIAASTAWISPVAVMVVLSSPFTSSLPVTVRSPTSAVSSPPTVISSTVTVSAVKVVSPVISAAVISTVVASTIRSLVTFRVSISTLFAFRVAFAPKVAVVRSRPLVNVTVASPSTFRSSIFSVSALISASPAISISGTMIVSAVIVVLPLPFTSSLSVTVRSCTVAVSSPPTVTFTASTVFAVTVASPPVVIVVTSTVVAFSVSASPTVRVWISTVSVVISAEPIASTVSETIASVAVSFMSPPA